MNEQQKARIVELAKRVENAREVVPIFTARGDDFLTACYEKDVIVSSAEAFRIAQEAR